MALLTISLLQSLTGGTSPFRSSRITGQDIGGQGPGCQGDDTGGAGGIQPQAR